MNCKKTLFWYKHNWNKWKVIDRGDITRADNSVIGKYIFQERICKDCNFKQFKIQKT